MKNLSPLILVILFALFFLSPAQAQQKNTLFLKADTLKRFLSKADTLSRFDKNIENIDDTIYYVNEQVSKCLSEILANPASLKVNLDSLLKHEALGKTHSPDKKLWIFSWYENTGGSWKSDLNILHYRTGPGKLKNIFVQGQGSTDESEFCSNGASFTHIYKLNSKTKNLYLCLGSGTSCNTCVYEIATVVELKGDSINFRYPAFETGADETEGKSSREPCFVLDARWNSIEKFEFNPKTQTLHIIYMTDDNTPVARVEGEQPKRITRKLVFNGTRFIGNGYQ